MSMRAAKDRERKREGCVGIVSEAIRVSEFPFSWFEREMFSIVGDSD